MSGHSKWASIKHKKAIVDKKKGKIFTKINREITVAAKVAGGKPESNPRLRKAIEDAHAANMPQENIKRAIQKGTGELPGATIEEVTYEGYGPGGVAVYVEATTDNKNRTTAEMRHLFSDHGGNMGSNGCVSFLFESKGLITVPKASISEEKITNLIIDAGAEDINADADDVYEITTSPNDLDNVKSKLLEAKVSIDTSEVSLTPKTSVKLEGEDAKKCLELMDALEEHEDVKTSSANFDIPPEIIDQVSAG